MRENKTLKTNSFENKEENAMAKTNTDNTLIVADGKSFSLDCYETKLNNNVLVVGASGTGKTRNIVIPNLLQASGSYIVCDPKGVLFKEYGEYMREQGYKVKYLDFIHPEKSDRYNPFAYLKTTQDILKMANMIVQPEGSISKDPFWDDAGTLLMASLISYIKTKYPSDKQTLATVLTLLTEAHREDFGGSTMLDEKMEVLAKESPDCWTVKMYNEANVAAEKTWNSILITLTAKLCNFNTEELNLMLRSDYIDIRSIGQKKTVLFVVVSDTDRSMDMLVNTFFTQAMNELCSYADEECEGYRLPVPVRFIMDDFATNVLIPDFDKIISVIRSREISVSIIVQSLDQLTGSYSEAKANTIINNCDHMLYLGGTDISTCKYISQKLDVPFKSIMSIGLDECILFERGSKNIGEYIEKNEPSLNDLSK